MQIFICPFCGPREESEFHYGGDAGNARPEGADVPAERWGDYLYMRNNPKGAAREVWVHMACGEFFVMERDSVGHTVTATHALTDGKHPE
ncbi:sarcosine oxidase subunit delta [Nordella sp. HKS 07]|uniref:sarcosine oxidase subunit delta n=1 Tax=Nordella sp. HKS 07 TaxID=2712222 RepID=UPI0013E1461B|nr:sarcosine oxidase subunit delta [Nordella sp. HKS 07]QIG52037.1 sarcosine oxidase subunit delta [Nordella sp. HKS 07]